jgi:hypothetical protein
VSASENPEGGGSQRARRDAGWVWLKVQVPPDLKRQLRSKAVAQGISLSQAHLDGLTFIAYSVPQDWWRQRRQATKVRFTRRDAGRKRAERQAPRGDGSGPKTPEA